MKMSEAPRTMIFIDGGYLRKNLQDIQDNENWDISKFIDNIHVELDLYTGLIIGGGVDVRNHVRTYYYDAIFDKDDKLYDDTLHKGKYDKYKSLFDSLADKETVEVKLGRLVISEKGAPRQKGVDTLFAIDVITKAFMNHFDVGIMFCGDRDFIPIVKAVKDLTGKHVYGVYFSNSCPEELRRVFDKRYEIPEGDLSVLKR